MKINLNEQEIHQAIREYIGKELMDLSRKQVTVEITAGRKPNGFYADVQIGEPDLVEETSETEPTEEQRALDI